MLAARASRPDSQARKLGSFDVLNEIAQGGMESLSKSERRILESATKKKQRE